jgi:hypothetical protein
VKKCSFCAQEIPLDAVACMFCNRAQPAPGVGRAPRSIGPISPGRLFVLAAFAAVAVMSWVTRWQPPTFENRAKKPLSVSGGRTGSGMVIVNRETTSLSDCVVRVGPPGGSRDWLAAVERLAGGEAQVLTWTQFRSAAGSEMPPAIGQSARYASVTCGSHKDTRSAAVIALR